VVSPCSSGSEDGEGRGLSVGKGPREERSEDGDQGEDKDKEEGGREAEEGGETSTGDQGEDKGTEERGGVEGVGVDGSTVGNNGKGMAPGEEDSGELGIERVLVKISKQIPARQFVGTLARSFRTDSATTDPHPPHLYPSDPSHTSHPETQWHVTSLSSHPILSIIPRNDQPPAALAESPNACSQS